MREIPAAAGVSEVESVAAIIVSKEVNAGDSSGRGCWRWGQQRRSCYVHVRRQRRRCYVRSRQRVVGGSEGVDGIWSTAAMVEAAARASAASGEAA